MNPYRLLATGLALLTLGLSLSLAAPANDNFAKATLLPTSFNFTSAGTSVGATMESAEPFARYDYTSSVWWRWTPAQSGRVVLSTSDPQLDTAMAIFQGSTLRTLSFAAYGEDIQPPAEVNSQIRFSAVGGETYYIAVFGYRGEEGAFNLTCKAILSSPANDEFANAIDLNGALPAEAAGSNQGASVQAYEPFHATEIGGASVWWKWTAPVSTNISVSTQGSAIDTLLAVYIGDDVASLDEVVSNDEANSGTSTSLVKFKAVAGTTYYIAVDGYDTDMGKIALTLTPQAPEKAHPWTLNDVDGNPVRSSDFDGKVILLNFWATWCGPCIAEMPDLIDLQNTYGPEGLVIIGISTDSDPNYVDLVRNFIPAHGLNYPIVLSERSGVEFAYGGIEYIPTTFVIDRAGNIVDKFVGTTSRAAFQAAILPLLTVTPTVPALSFELAGTQIALSWPDANDAFQLQRSASLNGAWSAVLETPSTLDGQRRLTLPVDAVGFFRLAPR